MNYSLRELECFVAVAEELSFTRAARRLHLAQPPLSRHVRALEDKLGAQLFERTRRTVRLTTAGTVLFEETRGLLPRLARAGDLAKRAGAGEVARLRLGFVSAVVSPELIETVRRFRARFPSVQLLLQDLPPAQQLEAINRGTLDAGFVGLEPAERQSGIRYKKWSTEPLACFVPAGHPLAACSRVALRDLAREPFVAVSSEGAPAFAAFVQDLCRTVGFRPRVVIESPRAQAVAVMVAAGSGIALLPESLSRFVGEGAVALPVAKAPPVVHVVAYATNGVAGPLSDFLALL